MMMMMIERLPKPRQTDSKPAALSEVLLEVGGRPSRLVDSAAAAAGDGGLAATE